MNPWSQWSRCSGTRQKHVGATGPEADARFRSAIVAGIPRQLALEQLRKRRRVALFRKRGVPVRAEARRRLESEWFAEFGYAPRRRRRLCDEEGIENLPTEVVTVDDNEVIINIRECSGVLAAAVSISRWSVPRYPRRSSYWACNFRMTTQLYSRRPGL